MSRSVPDTTRGRLPSQGRAQAAWASAVACAVVTCAMVTLGSGCAQGSGVLKRELRQPRQFEHVNASCSDAALQIAVSGADPQLEVSADSDVTPEVITRVTNDTLYISCAKAKSSQHPIVIRLATPTLMSVAVGSQRALQISELAQRELTVKIQGATPTQLTGRVQSLRLEATQAAQVRAHELQVQEATILVSPASLRESLGAEGFVAIDAVERVDVTMTRGTLLVAREPKRWDKKVGPEAIIAQGTPQRAPEAARPKPSALDDEPDSTPKPPAKKKNDPKLPKADERDAIDKALGY